MQSLALNQSSLCPFVLLNNLDNVFGVISHREDMLLMHQSLLILVLHRVNVHVGIVTNFRDLLWSVSTMSRSLIILALCILAVVCSWRIRILSIPSSSHWLYSLVLLCWTFIQCVKDNWVIVQDPSLRILAEEVLLEVTSVEVLFEFIWLVPLKPKYLWLRVSLLNVKVLLYQISIRVLLLYLLCHILSSIDWLILINEVTLSWWLMRLMRVEHLPLIKIRCL